MWIPLGVVYACDWWLWHWKQRDYLGLYMDHKLEKQIENNFTYHAPKDGQPEKYQALREKAKELAKLIAETVPQSREQSLALTKLEEATFWANAGIARN